MVTLVMSSELLFYRVNYSTFSPTISSFHHQKHGSNRFASTVAISGSDLERPRKRRKYRKLAKSQLRQAWQDGSDVASDDVGDDDHADGDVECKIKNSHSTGSGEREELDRLSSVLSFFNPSSKTIASSFSYDADVLGDASSGNFLSDNSEVCNDGGG